MDENLINHYKSMSITELLNEIANGRCGDIGSPNRDAINHILKVKEKDEEQTRNGLMLEYMQKNYRLNLYLTLATILLALLTAGLLILGSSGIIHTIPSEPSQPVKIIKQSP